MELPPHSSRVSGSIMSLDCCCAEFLAFFPCLHWVIPKSLQAHSWTDYCKLVYECVSICVHGILQCCPIQCVFLHNVFLAQSFLPRIYWHWIHHDPDQNKAVSIKKLKVKMCTLFTHCLEMPAQKIWPLKIQLPDWEIFYVPEETSSFPTLSSYLYFLFCPTLIYRETYPR